MPTYTVLLAQDVTYYGNVSVEGDTWEEAVASLVLDDWDECHWGGDDGGWEQRVVHVEAENGDIVADDFYFNCEQVHSSFAVRRLTHILDTCDLPDDAAAALVAFIEELESMVRDPIFKKDQST